MQSWPLRQSAAPVFTANTLSCGVGGGQEELAVKVLLSDMVKIISIWDGIKGEIYKECTMKLPLTMWDQLHCVNMQDVAILGLRNFI